MTIGYALQREHIHNRLHSEPFSDFHTVAFYTAIPDLTQVVSDHLFATFGEAFKQNVFKTIETFLDDAQCGGKLIEATFPDFDVLRFWLQPVNVSSEGTASVLDLQ